MFHTRNSSQHEAEFVLLDQLVEEDHLLRKIDQYIDFSFIIDKVKPYYSENKGRPSLDLLDHQITRFDFQVEAVALDSGYLTTSICKGFIRSP